MSERAAAWLRRALVAITCLPIVTALVRALRNDWFPIGDDALLFIRVADVGTHHHPLLGSWTSASLSVGENMNNPGPIYQDLTFLWSKFLSPGPAAAIGVAVVNIVAVVAIGLVAHRLGGDRMHRWAMLAAAALAWTMGSELLIDIWQAHALLLPFLLLLVLLVGVADGATWCVPWTIVVASVLVQTHISYAYVLALLLPVALGRYLYLRAHRPHRPWKDALLATRTLVWGGVLVLVWAQTFIEQFFAPGKGNLSRLAGNAGGGDLQVGSRQALGIGARLLTLPPWWLRSGFSSSVPSTPLSGPEGARRLEIADLPGAAVSALTLVVLVGVLVAGYLHHRRRDSRLLAAASLVAATGVVGGVLAISRLTVGPVGLAAHHVRWLWAFAVFVHVTVLALVARWVVDRLHRGAMVVQHVVAGVTVALALAAVPYLAHAEGPVADYDAMPALRRVFPELDSLRDVQPVLFDTSNLRPFEPYSSTVMMGLQERGIEFRVSDEGMIRQLGEARRADGSERARVFQLQGEDAVRYDGPACRIAFASALSPADEDDALGLAGELAQAIADGTITIDDDALRGDDAGAADLLDMARNGELPAAQRLVDGGYLARWYAAGLATTDDGDLAGRLPAALDLVGRFVDSAYGLFSEQDAPCP